MLDLRWAPLAQDDLTRIDRYHSAIDVEVADKVSTRIVMAAEFLRDTPLAGPAIGDRDRRKWRVRGTRYTLFYRVTGPTLRILRVFHTARDPQMP